MSKFAILRTKKLKSAGAMNLSLKHSFRDQETPNADPNLLHTNQNLIAQDRAEALQRFNDRLDTQEKIRKNAVYAIEYLITASPEAMHSKSKQSQDQYFEDALAWLKERHGAENVVCAGVHRDETTPHMFAYVVPIDERGKLNARAFLGGRDTLQRMQDEFAGTVGVKNGFERGIRGSKAKHQTVRQFYANLKDQSFDTSVAHHKPDPYDIDESDVRPKLLKETTTGLFIKTTERTYETAQELAHRLYFSKVKPLENKYLDEKQKRKKAVSDYATLKFGSVNATGLTESQRLDLQKAIDNRVQLNLKEKIEREKEAAKKLEQERIQRQLNRNSKKGSFRR